VNSAISSFCGNARRAIGGPGIIGFSCSSAFTVGSGRADGRGQDQPADAERRLREVGDVEVRTAPNRPLPPDGSCAAMRSWYLPGGMFPSG